MRVAVIGIGSNSLRMLVADILDGKLIRLKRYREGLRLFAALDEQNRLGEEAMATSCEKIRELCENARRDGATHIHIFATSAVRDAANQLDFAERIGAATGYRPDICDGRTEAGLSYWGAFEGENCALIDIGGGSTEIIRGQGMKLLFAQSLQVGAVRLFRDDPIAGFEDALRLEEKVLKLMQPVQLPAVEACRWVGVGGTFTTSVALSLNTRWEDKSVIQGAVLNRQGIENAIRLLAPMPMEERIALPSLQPQRADIIVHGLVILLACFDRWQMDRITVSECGNLEGYLKHFYELG